MADLSVPIRRCARRSTTESSPSMPPVGRSAPGLKPSWRRTGSRESNIPTPHSAMPNSPSGFLIIQVRTLEQSWNRMWISTFKHSLSASPISSNLFKQHSWHWLRAFSDTLPTNGGSDQPGQNFWSDHETEQKTESGTAVSIGHRENGGHLPGDAGFDGGVCRWRALFRAIL